MIINNIMCKHIFTGPLWCSPAINQSERVGRVIMKMNTGGNQFCLVGKW